MPLRLAARFRRVATPGAENPPPPRSGPPPARPDRQQRRRLARVSFNWRARQIDAAPDAVKAVFDPVNAAGLSGKRLRHDRAGFLKKSRNVMRDFRSPTSSIKRV
ncbi:hypothetical protein [Hoeflea sp.]|uniref:hypothetical protein n=1 Tax=Hoeflea sp. TaxID=1940281 RepID=UPI003B02A003